MKKAYQKDRRRKLLARTRRRWRREQRPKVYLEKEADDFCGVMFRDDRPCPVCEAEATMVLWWPSRCNDAISEGVAHDDDAPFIYECVSCGAVVTETDRGGC